MTDAPDLDGTYLAVLDRFEDDQAVFVIEDDDTAIAELATPRADLPDDGEHIDAVFWMQFDHGEVLSITYDADKTTNREDAAQDRFDRLSKRLPRDEDS